MPQQIELSDATFSRLQKLAVPLVDKTAEDVIKKLADFYEGEHAPPTMPSPKQAEDHPKRFNASAPPELTHTKLLSAKLDGTPLPKPNWNGLLFALARRTEDRLKNGEEANRLIIVNFVSGRKEDEGYRFIPEIGLSVQGQDANNAWRGACHIAKQLGIPLEVEFLWRNKEGAAFPGETGLISV